MKLSTQLSKSLNYHLSRIGFIALLFIALFLLLNEFKEHLSDGKEFRAPGNSIHCLEKADPIGRVLNQSATLKCLFG
ncbi:hypothetical protein JC525_16495 [Alteromonas sp. IB21]|uniref:hypothetical protein n=1 Tax=Alteromonas sp. IB21 TaxID=2779369 RepID=UPI0018E7E519|nr:hypothetical protein [Alteromonas sp. IB21]MBJ2130530.1 hypothetical protein [Alteromonas sp. IB21]